MSYTTQFSSPFYNSSDPLDRSEEDLRASMPSYTPRADITFPAFSVLRPVLDNPPPQAKPPSPTLPFGQSSEASQPAGGGQPQEQGDVSGFGSAPFISNEDSDNVFDSIGNIFDGGGDTSDWVDVGYNVARLFGGFADGGYVESDPMPFAEGGLVPLAGGGKIAIGPGGGLDDLIPTSINGRRAAALSDGEFVIPADVVSMMGDGSSNAGSRRLYDLVKQVRESKTGTERQAGPLPVGDILKRSLS